MENNYHTKLFYHTEIFDDFWVWVWVIIDMNILKYVKYVYNVIESIGRLILRGQTPTSMVMSCGN